MYKSAEEITREYRERYNVIVEVFEVAGFPVICGDTDSIYIKMVSDNKDD